MIIANSTLNAPRWRSIISYPTHARGIIVNYINVILDVRAVEYFSLSLTQWGGGGGGGRRIPVIGR